VKQSLRCSTLKVGCVSQAACREGQLSGKSAKNARSAGISPPPASMKGRGLGLAICRQLAELMPDGEVGVENTPGQSSTFWLSVMLEKSS